MAIRELSTLLASMDPLKGGEFLFVAVPEGALATLMERALAFFREEEGPTVLVPLSVARDLPAGSKVSAPHTLVTLNVNSDLEAVGFLAAVTARLAGEGISVNPISAFHHDHLLIPSHSVARAMEALAALSSDARG